MKQYKIKVNDSDMYLVTALNESDAVSKVSKIHNKFRDGMIKDVDWDFAQKLRKHSEEEIIDALKYSSPKLYKEYKNGGIQFAKLAGQLSSPEKEKVLKRLGDSNILSGYKYRIINNGSKWYYETTFPDGHTTLTGPYSSKQETEQYFHKHRPTEKLTDADPVKVEKIIRKEKSALGITYYLFQTKSSSGATIYYEVTDKTYHGEPTYSGGGIISFSLKSANDSLDSHLLSDKLKAKYGEKEGTKRFLRGENDSAIKDSNIKDAGFDTKYAEQQRRIDAEVRRAKELHKVSDALDYTTLFKQVFDYTANGSQMTKTVGDYTYVIQLNNNRIRYYVLDKSGNIPKGWCPTVTMYDECNIKDTSYYEPGDDIKDLYQISYKRNGVYQSILVRANSEEQAKQKLLNHKNGADIIGVNSNPSPHFHEPIID